MDSPHTGHSIEKLSAKISDIKSEFDTKLRLLADAQERIGAEANDLLSFAGVLAAAKDDSLLSLYESFGQIQVKYERSISEQIRALVLTQLRTESRLRTLGRLEEDRSGAITGEDISVIQRVDEFCAHVSHVSQHSEERFEAPGHPGNDLVPSFSTTRIRFKRFLTTNDSSAILSDTAELDGNEWGIKLFPFGNTDRPSAHSALFIELLQGFQGPASVYYRIEIVASRPGMPNVIHEFSTTAKFGQSWGWKKFHPWADLQSPDYIDDSGDITMIFGVHPESYFVLWKWIQAGNERKQGGIMSARAKAQARGTPRRRRPA
jgi:hypothetical protein